uniref:Uncharacterized protein n=1 Tax=viral metagenome TaxID=1070528 RepID=A0A6M3LGJ1_9ZZZZ
MSLLACDRKGCENIMDRYSSKYGYICHECFEELVQLGPTTDIKSFMDSVKIETDDKLKRQAEDRFDAEFEITFNF